MVQWLWVMRCGVSMGDLNLLRPYSKALQRSRRWALSGALVLGMLGIYSLFTEREAALAQLKDQQQLQAEQRTEQQQWQLQRAALRQRQGLIDQQRRVVSVLRGVALSKSATAHYTKVHWAADGWSLRGQAASHKEVAGIVSILQAAVTDQIVAAAKVVAVDNSPRVNYEIRLRPLSAISDVAE